MSLLRILVTRLVRFLLSLLCRVDASELRKLPKGGPLVVVTNHVNFLEVPLLYCWFWPRRLIGLVKRETWDMPVLGFLARLWEAIPIERVGGDLGAMRAASDLLASGGILAIAPEGTRSGNGKLLRGRPGVVTLAIRSRAPIIPVVHTGGESFWRNFRSFRRTRVRLRVGRPFVLEGEIKEITHGSRAQITDEIMREIARLLPPGYRGAYADPPPESIPAKHLRYL